MSSASRPARVLVTAGAAVWTALAGCSSPGQAAGTPAPEPGIEAVTFAASLGIDLTQYTQTRAGSYYLDVVEGTGARAVIDRRITIRYVLYLPTGIVVEAPKTPVTMTLGADVIRGWRDALPGMKVGGVRRLIVPPSQAYGRKGNGSIPANSTLVFRVELLGVQ